MLDLLPHLVHRRVVIDSLAGKDVPIVKSGWLTLQVPFADDRGRVARRLHDFWECLLPSVEPAVTVVVKAVHVRVFSRQDCRSTGSADRIRHQAAIKSHPFFGQPIHLGRFQQSPFVAVSADRLTGQIVGEDQQDIGPSRLSRVQASTKNKRQQHPQSTDHTIRHA